MDTLKHAFIPELGMPRSGKVREIYDGTTTMTLISSDRFSAFNYIFPEPIPDKGRILNEISKYWFDHTSDIIQNHLISMPDPNVSIVKKCTPLLVEVVVRGYVVGSLWRDYAKGSRVKSGVSIPDGLKEHDKLPTPIVTPTAKSKDDPDVTPEQIIDDGIVTKEIWDQICSVSLKLFQRGEELAAKQGLVLIDTKYEFGLDSQEKLILIDEVHTPDSSRFRKQGEFKFLDKEFARKWIWDQGYGATGKFTPLSPEIIEKVRDNYRMLYELITGKKFQPNNEPISDRLCRNLKKAGMIKGGFVLVIGENTPSFKGLPHKITNDFIQQFNESIEPVIIVSNQHIKTHWPQIPLNEQSPQKAKQLLEELQR